MRDLLTRRRFLSGALATGGALAPGKGYYDAGNLRLNRVILPVAGLPAPFEGMRIGFAADFHHSPIGRLSLFRRAGELLRESDPDLILLGGDFVNESEAPDPVPRARELIDALGPLAAPLGLFAVTGNHDLWLGHDATELLKGTLTDRLGVTWLDNRHVPLLRGGATLTLAGVADPYSARADVAAALAGDAGAAPVILLSHSPDVNAGLGKRPQVKLVLAGHTHGGQIAPPAAATANSSPSRP
ncbi:MAG: metallophosphoesterase [Nitrospinae bacterium]|nr:metallophosphoesterase [Nitrospinota bacterium]